MSECEPKWLRIADTKVLLLHDMLGPSSEIEVYYKDGSTYGYCIPLLDEKGHPANHGQYPTMEDLERIVRDLVAYLPHIEAHGVDSLARMAIELNSRLTDRSTVFEWIDLLKTVEADGMAIDVDDTQERAPAF